MTLFPDTEEKRQDFESVFSSAFSGGFEPKP